MDVRCPALSKVPWRFVGKSGGWYFGRMGAECQRNQGGLCGWRGPGIGPCQIRVLSPGRTGEVFIIFFPGGDGWRQAGAWRADGAVG